ncbi:hypothetical protein LOZ53_005274 [Ophidiomyces ophidiicola]|nr:hypothetical protein LOZ55_005643 [Ophidiomyces ophidiicola]KAI1980066.1 hypothetical protein LOZ54_005928 [Ophidiomyces ophidiicola]KAI1984894.1 hypothetical protein LOZ53_005274 [Ophidiomyces ophidiicola]KAI2003363.1 hypothetical protein LOZ51_000441 [Ophidiomyces ophidiicola]
MTTRSPTHAGSWYSNNASILAAQLENWMSRVPNEIEGVGTLPVTGARVIIAPHAGYTFSGACAAYAYKCLDLSKAKRIFLIGPSHHHPFSKIALPELSAYATPLSPDPLPIDTDIVTQLLAGTKNDPVRFTTMNQAIDEAEHSLELHLPYIHYLLQRLYPNKPAASYPKLVPMLVGSTSANSEQAFGKVLAPYLANPENAFVVSSDFCHWGMRFAYTYYLSNGPAPQLGFPLSFDALPQPCNVLQRNNARVEIASADGGRSLRAGNDFPETGDNLAIHESISVCDIACMAAIASSHSRVFLDAIQTTGNTICGRHPIAVIMAAIEFALGTAKENNTDIMMKPEDQTPTDLYPGSFYFTRYERSSHCQVMWDSSVSYVSAFAVL